MQEICLHLNRMRINQRQTSPAKLDDTSKNFLPGAVVSYNFTLKSGIYEGFHRSYQICAHPPTFRCLSSCKCDLDFFLFLFKMPDDKLEEISFVLFSHYFSVNLKRQVDCDLNW